MVPQEFWSLAWRLLFGDFLDNIANEITRTMVYSLARLAHRYPQGWFLKFLILFVDFSFARSLSLAVNNCFIHCYDIPFIENDIKVQYLYDDLSVIGVKLGKIRFFDKLVLSLIIFILAEIYRKLTTVPISESPH